MNPLLISLLVAVIMMVNYATSQMAPRIPPPVTPAAQKPQRQAKTPRAPKPKPKKFSPRSAMDSYCLISDSDPNDGNQMKERLMDYVGCKESAMVSIKSLV